MHRIKRQLAVAHNFLKIPCIFVTLGYVFLYEDVGDEYNKNSRKSYKIFSYKFVNNYKSLPLILMLGFQNTVGDLYHVAMVSVIYFKQSLRF